MSSFSVPDIISFNRLSQSIGNLKTKADTTRTEAVTGRYEDLTAHLKGDVGSANLLQKAIDDAKSFASLLSLSEQRVRLTQTSLESISVAAGSIGSAALSAFKTDDLAQLDVISAQAKDAVQGIFVALSSSLGGRFLFSGDGVTQAPLASAEQLFADVEAIFASAADVADAEAQLDFYFNDPAGGFETTIYQGGAGQAPDAQIAPGVRVDASVKANAPEIKALIRSLAEIASYNSAGFVDAEMIGESGAKDTLSAEANIIALRSAIGISEARISTAKERYIQEQDVLTKLFNDKTARDPFEAASELQLLESQLERSYLLTSRLGRLSLADFIR